VKVQEMVGWPRPGLLGEDVYGSVRRAALRLRNLRAFAHMPLSDLTARDRVHIFHHIPRSGGTSVSRAMQRWFWIIRDYRPVTGGDEDFFRNRKPICSLRNYQCLAGHFATDGGHLAERYPEVFGDKRFRVFTFLRDPLEAKISLYYYEKRHGMNAGVGLEQHLLGRSNYIANRFPCTATDYRSVLGGYFFVGVTEHMQDSLDKLAGLVGRPRVKVPLLNEAARDQQVLMLSPTVLREFRHRNELDYLIYQYGLDRLTGT